MFDENFYKHFGRIKTTRHFIFNVVATHVYVIISTEIVIIQNKIKFDGIELQQKIRRRQISRIQSTKRIVCCRAEHINYVGFYFNLNSHLSVGCC